MVNMVRAGEIGGFLDAVLLQVAENYEAEVKLRGKIKSAMTYPVVVFIMVVAVVDRHAALHRAGLREDVRDLGGTLPLPTRMLMGSSNVLTPLRPGGRAGRWSGWSFLFRRWSRSSTPSGCAATVDPLKLKVPVFGPLFQKIALSPVHPQPGTMIHSGVPDPAGPGHRRRHDGNNVVIARAVRDVQESVREGESLAAPLAKHAVFPPMVVQMMAVGEDTGALDNMLGKIADFYDQEVEAAVASLTS